MTVGLFIPCYIDQFYPQVGVATLELLESLNINVVYPPQQTCCGQPMANSGAAQHSYQTARLFVDNFVEFDYIVAPSGSCIAHVKEHYSILGADDRIRKIHDNSYELCEFLTDVVQLDQLSARFPYRVGLHQSCHGLRGLRLAKDSELVMDDFSKIRYLLDLVDGLELVPLERSDECCGFGGTFAVAQEALSVKMGRDRIADHEQHGAEVITAADMSCLMHLEGIIRRQNKPLRVMHVAEILNHR